MLRRRRAQELLERRHLDALLIVATSSRDPDLAPFVGPVHLGECLLVVPLDGSPRLGFFTAMERGEAAATGLELLAVERLQTGIDPAKGGAAARKAEQWRRALVEAGLDGGRIGLGGHYPAGLVAGACRLLDAEGWQLEDAHADLRRLRRTKSPDEVAEIRRVAAGASRALRLVASMLAESDDRGGSAGLVHGGEPLSVGRLRRAIARELAADGLSEPEGNIVSLGSDSAVPHTQGASERIVEAGRAIVVDLYPKGHLFADCTRTFCVGDAPEEVRRAHALVLEALTQAASAAVPGVHGASLQDEVCERFEAAGWPTQRGTAAAERGYVHGLGHGVGYELHELPVFRGDMDTELAVGDVFTLEPGLYDPEQGFGVRLEDLLVMREAEAECLTPLPYDLDPRAW